MRSSRVPFYPLPLLAQADLQTILGSLFKGPPFRYPTEVRAVGLPDGDRLALHDSVPPDWKIGDRMALLIHGLGGSPNSGFVRRIASRLYEAGVRPVRIDLRGSGAGLSWAKRAYNAGCSPDVRAAVAEMRRWAPTSPVLLFGFSLGGNVALKLAGELPEHPCDGLAKVIAVAPPIDLPLGSRLIAKQRNRLYDWYFSRDLMALARLRAVHFPDPPLPEFPKRMTLKLFDELYTAPRWGYRSADEYYAANSSAPLIGRIPVPTLILTAADDPVIPVEAFRRLKAPPKVEVRITSHGGHLGFLGPAGDGGFRWAERWIVRRALERP